MSAGALGGENALTHRRARLGVTSGLGQQDGDLGPGLGWRGRPWTGARIGAAWGPRATRQQQGQGGQEEGEQEPPGQRPREGPASAIG